MQNQFHPEDVIEELDEVLEDLEETDLQDPAFEDEDVVLEAPPDSFIFKSSIFPVLIINRNFRIIYENPACHRLFTGFFKLEGNQLFDVFGKSFGLESIRDIRDTVLHGKNGFSWKGISRLKTREIETVETRVFLFPSEVNTRDPNEFVVLFDDVTEENKHLLRSVFMSLLEASKLKDNDTGQHITRVNYYSRKLSEELYHKPGYEHIDADFIDDIGFLASMHDVGKIGTPDDILNKEGPLSDWEWSVMQEHTKNGAYILSTYPNPMAKEIALSHHERWDGSGYPFQLVGDMIPLPARIVAIADVYDALRMKRSYKDALDHRSTVKKIKEESGTHFDPSLVEVFSAIADDFDAIYEEHKDIGTKNPNS
ncbi:HD domain-containing phosphohydrolase [Breznakiella homolactica]|uniref:HD-GYP domain-containing protein n=1 Tax=Breznakiella homolactica TaxID=2798577 RepID=A0A7T7XJI4_9SPIR|nr:HD-GYP domain-containing protein [Breznakiella homolactica]QQO07526.1 HD-GYP domain-containing protein [Breznakiella homolactica]